MLNTIYTAMAASDRCDVKSCKMPASQLKRIIAAAVTAASLCACSGPTAIADEQASAHNCLLPGQVRRIAGQNMLSARRAVNASKLDCEQRGGKPQFMSDSQ